MTPEEQADATEKVIAELEWAADEGSGAMGYQEQNTSCSQAESHAAYRDMERFDRALSGGVAHIRALQAAHTALQSERAKFVERCEEIREGSPNAFYKHVDAYCKGKAQLADRGETLEGCTHCGCRVKVESSDDHGNDCDGCCLPWEPAYYQRVSGPHP